MTTDKAEHEGTGRKGKEAMESERWVQHLRRSDLHTYLVLCLVRGIACGIGHGQYAFYKGKLLTGVPTWECVCPVVKVAVRDEHAAVQSTPYCCTRTYGYVTNPS